MARKTLAEDLDFDPSLPLIVNVAYHTPQKGMETLVSGLAHLKDKSLDFICLLAGDGELSIELKKTVKELGIDKQVRFLGIRKDVPTLLAAADIFALPSNFEGLGTSILDALHSGCAVAASDVGGIPEMIIHEQSGLLSPAGDGRSHGENLERLIRDPELRQRLADQGRQKALSDFSIHSMVEGNLKLYQRLIDQR